MKKLFLITASICLFFVGCEKSDRDEDTTTNSAEDYALATGLVFDVFKIIHQASSTSQGIISTTIVDSTSIFGCDTIIFDGAVSPKTLEVNFDNNCTSSNVVRNGIIYASYNGYYDTPGTVTTVTFNDYFENDFVILSGTISYQYNGVVNSEPTYSVTFSDVKIRNNQNQKLFYSGTSQLRITDGGSTPLFSDDEYVITGSSSSQAFKGNPYTVQISDSLVVMGDCNWVSSGTVLVKPQTKNVRTLDFGSGCDNNITITLYDINYELSIP